MPSLLFVCTANICRSPMAMVLFEKMASRDHPEEGWIVESAGTWAIEGVKAAEGAQFVMKKYGLDLRDHRSRNVNRDILQKTDLVLVMEKGHKEALRAEFNEYADRIFLLSEMIDKVYDIKDPIGGSMSDYEDTAQELEQLLNQGYFKIKKLAKSGK